MTDPTPEVSAALKTARLIDRLDQFLRSTFSAWLEDELRAIATSEYARSKKDGQEDVRKALTSLRNEVAGVLGAFEYELRDAISNTNFGVLEH